MTKNSDQKHLVFIGGFPSGGTDLLKNILNAHPNIYLNGEMPFLYKLQSHLSFAINEQYTQSEAKQILKWLSDHDIWDNLSNKKTAKETIRKMNKDNIDKYKFFCHLFSEKDRMVWGNKTPQNTENAQTLFKLFPDSKLIILTRDVRDVVLSWKKKWGKNPYLVADKWNRRMCKASSLAKNNDRILLKKFEELLSETETVTKEICHFINIEWDKKMLNYHQHVDHLVDGKINYGKPINKGNKLKWKEQSSHKFVNRIEEIAFDGLQQLNYDIAYAQNKRPLKALHKKYGLFHDALAMIFVGNRSKDDNSVSDRLSEVVKQIKLKTS